jgi:pimeloyl-ACP methyl ester carboxylesterase
MFLQYQAHRIHYTKFGKGPKLLITFHGFGDQGDLFLKLRDSLENHYTVVVIDAPFHGETEWQKNIFYPKDIRKIVEAFRYELGFERFSLMAHSMGGLFIIGIFKYIAAYVDELILLAPAGLQKSVIYNKLLFNYPIRRFFKWTASRPGISSKLLSYSQKFGWLDRITHLFFTKQLEDELLRRRMFNTWSSLYFFPRKLRQFRRLIRRYNIEVLMFYGERDKLTPKQFGENFVKKLKRKKFVKAEIKTVNDGHFMIREPLNKALKEKMADNS